MISNNNNYLTTPTIQQNIDQQQHFMGEDYRACFGRLHIVRLKKIFFS
jgi:hypothetical protein